GAELLDPAQQVVTIDQSRRHIRRHRSEHEPRLHHAVQLPNRASYLFFRDMAQAGLEYEIEFAVFERHIDDRAERVEPLQLFRRPGMDRAVVLDAPGIDAARTQRSHQFPAGGPRDQELVALRPAPDDLDDVHEIGGIGELVPNLAVRADPAIVPEIAAVDLVRRRLAVLGAAAA